MPPRVQNRVGARGSLGAATPTPTVGALWALVAVEVGTLIVLRRYYRKHHGG